jgi:hypothetical protein
MEKMWKITDKDIGNYSVENNKIWEMTMWKKSWKTTYGKFVGKNGVEKIADK